MKKLTAILIAIFMIFSSVSAFAGVVEDLKSISVLPENVSFDADSEELITREEFAYIAAKIMSGLDYEAKDTVFADVKADNPYSGYIDYLKSVNIVSGTDGAVFNPKSPIEVSAANKMLVSVLGYGARAESNTGYPVGYDTIATELRLYKNVAVSGKYLTRYNAATLVHNALMTETMDGFGDKSGMLLSSYLKISAYDGEIVDADTFTRTATFKVNNTKFAAAGKYLSGGETLDLTSINTVNVADYERVPATIWVNENDLIVNIIPQRNVEVKYGYVYSVNGDKSESSAYRPSNIDQIFFTNEEDEYTTSNNLIVKYNDSYTESPVKISQRFIKAVIIADEIKYIESWDIKHGGLIESIGDNDIRYTQGTATGCKFENTMSEKKIKVFINNRSSDIADLKVESTFDYYENGDNLVIVASEKHFDDFFSSYSAGDYVEIGNTICELNGDVFTSKKDGEFVKNTDIASLMNREVRAYISPAGYVKYIVSQDAIGSNEEFYGIVTGINENYFKEILELEMYKIVGDTVTEEVYSVSDNVRYLYEDGSLDEIKSSIASMNTGASLYVFKLNGNGKIINVKKPTNFYGTTPAGSNTITDDTNQDQYGWVWSGEESKRIQLYGTQTLMHLSMDGSDLVVTPLKWSSLSGRMTGDEDWSKGTLYFKFYGEDMEETPDLMLCFGDVDKFFKTGGRNTGLYLGRTIAIDEEGEQYNKLKVLTSDGVQTYSVTKDFGDKIDTDTGGTGVIYYATGLVNAKSDILYLKTHAKLDSTHDEWLNEVGNEDLDSGVIKKKAGKRIYFEGNDGKALYMSDSALCFELNEGSSKNRFTSISASELKPGDTIFYRLSNYIISWIIVVR